MPARWPTGSSWTSPSGAGIPGTARSSRCTTCVGMPLPDVAAALGIPLGTAKSRLHHALASMRRSTRRRARPGLPRQSPEGRSHDRRQPVRARPARRSSRTCTWGHSRLPHPRPWRPPSARGSARPGPSQEGGSPWLTLPAVPRSRRVSRCARSGWRCSSSRWSSPAAALAIGSRKTSVPPPSGSRATACSPMPQVATSTSSIRRRTLRAPS